MGYKPLLLCILFLWFSYLELDTLALLLHTFPAPAPGAARSAQSPAPPCWRGVVRSQSQGWMCLLLWWGVVSRPPGGQSQDRCVWAHICVSAPICSDVGHPEFRLIPLVPDLPVTVLPFVCENPGPPVPPESVHLLSPRKHRSSPRIAGVAPPCEKQIY